MPSTRSQTLILALLLASCGSRNGPDPQLAPTPYAAPPPGAATSAPAAASDAPATTSSAPDPAPTLPPRPEGEPCTDWTPTSPLEDVDPLVAEVSQPGIVGLAEMSCAVAAVDPPPCDAETCRAWVEHLSYDALVLYQKFEVDAALAEALQAVKLGRDCGLTGRTMARAYVGLGYILADGKNEMVKASHAFRWAFLLSWDVVLPFPSAPPNVEMTFRAARSSLGPTEISCQE